MHNESCEDSWRPAGFRAIQNTRYLASCAQKGHRCRNEKAPDPPLLVIAQEPSVNLDPVTEIIIHLVCKPYHPDQAGILGSAHDIRTSRYTLSHMMHTSLASVQDLYLVQ